MSMYHPGYHQARQAVEQMPLSELLEYIDNHAGGEAIKNRSDIEEVRFEALRRCRRAFIDTNSEEYKKSQFWSNVHKKQGMPTV